MLNRSATPDAAADAAAAVRRSQDNFATARLEMADPPYPEDEDDEDDDDFFGDDEEDDDEEDEEEEEEGTWQVAPPNAAVR